MPVLGNENSQRAGIINAVADTWRQHMPIFAELQKDLLFNVPYTNLRLAQYVWKEALPFPKKWNYGAGRFFQTIQDRLVEIRLDNFELSIPFNLYDERDDQLGDLRTHVSLAIQRFFMLPDKLMSEYLNGVLTNELNTALNNTYDGAALFSALEGDGATNRLGVAGGNIITGSGITTDAIINDVALAQRRFLDMRDTADQVIFQEADVDYKNLRIICNPALNESVQKASGAEYIKSDPTLTVAESNYQKGTWSYKLNPYLTDTQDYYVLVRHQYWKPFIYRQPSDQGIRSIFADFDNSDRARERNEAALHADVRVGLTPWFMGSIIKVNN